MLKFAECLILNGEAYPLKTAGSRRELELFVKTIAANMVLDPGVQDYQYRLLATAVVEALIDTKWPSVAAGDLVEIAREHSAEYERTLVDPDVLSDDELLELDAKIQPRVFEIQAAELERAIEEAVEAEPCQMASLECETCDGPCIYINHPVESEAA
jgi:hypothetical protein